VRADRARQTLRMRVEAVLFDADGVVQRPTADRHAQWKALLGGADDAGGKFNVAPRSEENLRVTVSRALRDMEITIGPMETRARLVHPVPVPTPTGSAIEYDVFICHASEDKADVAQPLAEALQRREFRVWLDTFEIRIGDRILSKIDDGLRRSRYGVVIISPSFFGKQWSQMELNALAALEASAGRTKILPVWHKMTRAQVEEQSPLMAAVRAANTADGIEAISDEIATVLRS